MRKSGLQMLLASMGIDINPEEIMAKYNQAKDIMPKLAEFVSQLDARLARIEERLNIHATDTGRISVDRSGGNTRTDHGTGTGTD